MRPLLALAATWAIGDDVEREDAVARASESQLSALVEAVDRVPDDDLYGWLTGDESHRAPPSPEYIAVTLVTMAADSARQRLRDAE